MVIDPQYVRPLPTHDEERLWRLQEAACFFWLVEIGMALMLGLLSWHWLLHAYMTAITIMTLNALRTLVAHRYLGHGGEMTFLEQLLDSVNFPNSRLSAWIWAPVGLRFHALHHLFPAMPYHNLDEANRRLMEQLPHDSAYRQTHCRSLPSAIADLVRNSLAAGRRTTATVAPVSEPQEECSVG
jgi:fatty acid desaturase